MDHVMELKHIDASYGGTLVLRDVNLKLERYRTVGLVGESGSGKSTIARVMTGLLKPDKGEILLEGSVISGGEGRQKRRSRDVCRRIQMVFQNPEASLNPKYSIGRILSDAMLFHQVTDRAHVTERCREWVQLMHLPEDTLERYPRSFSGGQRQRIALARALCVEPQILIADEPTSALDVSVQLEILKLMERLRKELELTILFISHDLGVIHYLCDEVAVMKQGEILEYGAKEDFFSHPQTEYGCQLLNAVPDLPVSDI
ncbi:MAG: ABC transporter ATP-binding protein [Enterocloster sp.]